MKLTVVRENFRLDVDLPVEEKERIGVIGPNGSGKSSLLGSWYSQAREQNIPAVLLEQRTECFPHLTVVENVAFSFRARGINKATAREQALEVLTQAGMDHLAQAFPHSLSGGQQQRVVLLRALATGATTALLDEPLVGLDISSSREYRELLATHPQIKQLVIAVHDPKDLLQLVDRVLLLDDGVLVADMPTQDFFATPPNAFAAEIVDCNRVEMNEVLWFSPQHVVIGSGSGGFVHHGVVHSIDVSAHRSRINIDLRDLETQRIVAEVEDTTSLSPGETCTVRVDEKHLRRGKSIQHLSFSEENVDQ